jgi:hypothetical protein
VYGLLSRLIRLIWFRSARLNQQEFNWGGGSGYGDIHDYEKGGKLSPDAMKGFEELEVHLYSQQAVDYPTNKTPTHHYY